MSEKCNKNHYKIKLQKKENILATFQSHAHKNLEQRDTLRFLQVVGNKF